MLSWKINGAEKMLLPLIVGKFILKIWLLFFWNAFGIFLIAFDNNL